MSLTIRAVCERILQELIEAEATARIGAEWNEHTESPHHLAQPAPRGHRLRHRRHRGSPQHYRGLIPSITAGGHDRLKPLMRDAGPCAAHPAARQPGQLAGLVRTQFG